MIRKRPLAIVKEHRRADLAAEIADTASKSLMNNLLYVGAFNQPGLPVRTKLHRMGLVTSVVGSKCAKTALGIAVVAELKSRLTHPA